MIEIGFGLILLMVGIFVVSPIIIGLFFLAEIIADMLKR